MSCPYYTKKSDLSSLLGDPHEGFHEARLGNYAMNDIFGTLAIAGVSSYATNTPYWQNLLAWFAIAEASHIAFGVRTQLLVDLGVFGN